MWNNWVSYLNALDEGKKKPGFPWSTWKRALGDMPVAEMPVDKQPSVAITIQKGYSYFSAINSSLLTHGSQSACSQRINLHPSHTPGRLRHSELIIDPAGAPWRGRGDLPQWDAVRPECGSIQVELLVAVLQKHCAALWSTSTWKHLSGWSPAPHGKTQSSERRISDPRFIQHRPVSMSVERQHSLLWSFPFEFTFSSLYLNFFLRNRACYDLCPTQIS